MYIDGRHETEFGLKRVSGISVPPLANFDNNLQDISSNKLGLWDFGTSVQTKPITASFVIPEVSKDEAYVRAERFVSLFLDERGIPKVVKMVLDFDPNRYYYVKLASSPTNDRDVLYRTNMLELNLIANPGVKFSNVENDEVYWGSEEILFVGGGYTMGHNNYGASFKVNSNSTVPIEVSGLSLKPTIILTGSANNLIIENKGNKINVGSFTNKTWRIETEDYIAYEGNVERIIRMDRDWYLHKGANNVIFKGTNIDLDVTIQFRDRWH